MQEIGSQLREAREARQISLEQAEEETKIRKKYLEALENGTPEVIPGDVYVRGFLRSYANWLGLDGPGLVEQYKSSQSVAPQTATTGTSALPSEQTESPAPVGAVKAQSPAVSSPEPPRPRRDRHKPGMSGLPLLVACGVAAVALAGYLIVRGLSSQSAQPPAQPPVTQQGAQNPAPGTTSSISTGDGSTAGTGTGSGPGTTATGNPASTETPAAKVTMNKPKGEAVLFDVNGTGPIDVALEFDAKTTVYMKVTVDGKVVAEQTTTDPTKTRWTGKTITIRLGHAQTLKAIKVNGVTFDKPLKGGPFTLTFAPHA